ncbi:hypothetical protein BIW11_05554 [Tropilaelaps mercedesae]|uniref:Uncharacterized protein n=1 Tax=Tropilaelaps mercedesae TaxID=418985 RepID=A0A1V9Y1T3_9ACAR|nr:hypothetical protein BIW11_05554 [Tropilaelaps mercedesae]
MKWIFRENYQSTVPTVSAFGVQLASFTMGVADDHMYHVFSNLESHKNSRNVGRRFITTIKNLMKWYDTDIFDKKSPGYRSILATRAIHRLYMKKLPQRLGEHPEGHQWLSQTYMALVQMGMIGPLLSYPLNLTHLSDEDLEGMVHFWRVLGYMVGINDRYNVCRDGVAGLRSLTKEFVKNRAMPSLTSLTLEKATFSGLVCDAIVYTFLMPVQIFNIILALGTMVDTGTDLKLNFVGSSTWYERALVKCVKFAISRGLFAYSPVRVLLNFASRWFVKHANAEKLSTEPFNKTPFPKENFVCPYSASPRWKL